MSNPPWTSPSRTMPPRATAADFDRAAAKLRCEVAVIRAVWKVEAAGKPFRNDGSLTRRFEPHHFPKKFWGAIGFAVRAGEAAWRASVRLSNDVMAMKAYNVSPEAMMWASSWGGPQIMGFNCKDCGFPTAGAMVVAMQKGEGAQIDAFVDLIESWGLASALRARDWATFARRYNGPGQVTHYAGLLSKAFGVTSTQNHAVALEAEVRKQGAGASKVVLRIGSEGASVKALQVAVGAKPDGVFGRETERMVRAFQTAAGLHADGIVGAKTWAAIEARMPKATAPVSVQPATNEVAPAAAAAATAVAGAIATAVADVPDWTFPATLGGLAVVGVIYRWLRR